MPYQSFEDLEVWKRACQMAVTVYSLLKDCRDFSFRDQMQRAVISISSNIAEGSERNSVKEFVHFIHIAKGSAAELRTQLYIAEKVRLISSSDCLHLVEELKKISKMLHALAVSIKPKDYKD